MIGGLLLCNYFWRGLFFLEGIGWSGTYFHTALRVVGMACFGVLVGGIVFSYGPYGWLGWLVLGYWLGDRIFIRPYGWLGWLVLGYWLGEPYFHTALRVVGISYFYNPNGILPSKIYSLTASRQ